ncbi:SusC/RagA family TonB-linked outer membrane protein [Mucilaginibacter paludis]|uniref:TonB-dependent receptor plug n=1 Tax=Mucilaginibacter paludis DSM 18603 TaxID=714943 RepID=H1YH32_9SPHI|nr:SusC/RagA family TonB-linked outer membrane protein [Mucilaginibacter paludis]EHQ27441.1 TonB-dependent receptor plug [Mucilaginibacter paludis DSM 18603]
MKKYILRITCFLLIVFSVNSVRLKAQVPEKVTVRGKVTDKKDKSTVIGASVVELDKDKRVINGQSTDINGNYALRVASTQNQIQVSAIGYKTLTLDMSKRTVIDIQLMPNGRELNEISIQAKTQSNNGTGMNIDKRDVTTATSTISAKDLEELSATSIDQALQGRLPGVDISATSGDPGAGMSIRIRGTSSLNGSSNPLIILDGMPYETQVPDDFNFGTADEQGYAQLLNIAPTDIKDITVLKDAASTALWGSRAANGVLIITTKRGVIGKPILSYNFKGTRSKQPNAIPLLTGDQYSMLIPEEIANKGGYPINTLVYPEFNYDPRDVFNFYNYSNNTNWINEITQTGYIQDHNVSMQGGGEKARYYASVGFLNQRGTTVGTALSRITTKINLDYNVSNRIRFRSDFSYTHINNDLSYSSTIRDIAYNKMPNMSVYRYDEFGRLTPVFFSPASNIQGQFSLTSSGAASGTANPLALAESAFSKQTGERITPHFNVQYDIKPNILLATFDIQFDINTTKSKNFLPQIATGRPASESVVNRATDNDGDTYGIDSKFNLIYTPQFKSDKHRLQTLVSIQTHDSRSIAQNITTANSASSNLTDVSDPARIQSGDFVLRSSDNQNRSIGVVLSNQYAFLDRYIINVGGRLDGNSNLSTNNRFGVFPAVSARWRVSGEPFMKKLKFLDDLSMRASYGLSGRSPDANYTFYNTYNPTGSSYAGESAVVPGNIGLDNLRWERKTGRNLGLNLWTLKNRLMVDIEVYNDKTTDLLFNNLKTPAYTGYPTVTANIGTIVNKGFEIGVNTIPYKSKNLVVGFDFNFSKNQNTMTEVSDQFPKTDGKKINTNGIYRTYLQVGNPFGSFYGFRYKGVYSDLNATVAKDVHGKAVIGPGGQPVYMRFNYPATDYTFQPGDAIYEDINHDGNINEDDIVYLGNSIPKISGGFGPSITWKGALKISAFFVFKSDFDIINETDMKTSNMYSYNNQSTVVLRRWRNPGDITDVPRALQGAGYNWLGSDRYVSDASFLRWQSVTARYTIGKVLLNRLKVKNASIYITAENVYTWTNYLGVNPDVSNRGNTNPFSYISDQALTPPSKNITVGITVGF